MPGANGVAIAHNGTIHTSASEKAYAINPDGSTRWITDIGSGIVSLPIVDGLNTVYYRTTKNLIAVRDDGSIKWKLAIESGSSSNAVFGKDGTMYLSSSDGYFYAYGDADLNDSGRVNFVDFAIFFSHWLDDECKYPNWCDGTDLDCSGRVDFNDYTIFAPHWEGQIPPDECFPSNRSDYDKWVLIGRPNCWCCLTQCQGDVNCDGVVDDRDRIVLNHSMGTIYPDSLFNPCVDFNHDLHINTTDLATFTAWYGTRPPGGCIELDLCPDDPNKTKPGTCGCGMPDIDVNGDGIADCGFRYGDINGDSEVTAYDAALAAQCSAGLIELSNLQRFAADVDGNGCISEADADLIVHYAVRLITVFPVELMNPKPTTLPTCGCEGTNLNFSGQVEFGDLATFVENWLEVTTP